MSKLMTDSKTLTDLLDAGITEDDNLLSTHIEALKQAAFDCMEIQVTGQVMTDDELKEKSVSIGRAIIEVWQVLSALKTDFVDILTPSKEKGGEA